jgi:hypothetical protein
MLAAPALIDRSMNNYHGLEGTEKETELFQDGGKIKR